MNKKILEEDLSKPIQDFLENRGYKVRSEVGFCDITALKNGELVVVELKKNLSIELLIQAVKRQKFADTVYIAIPKPEKMTSTSKWQDICHLLRRLELGLILVSFKGGSSIVEIPIHPAPFDRLRSIQMNKGKKKNILEEMEKRSRNLNKGGSAGKKLVTAYRESAVFIACCLQKLGPLSPKKLRRIGTDEKKTISILYENHYGWFDRIERGIYAISCKGIEDLKQYPELTSYYSGIIDKFCTDNLNEEIAADLKAVELKTVTEDEDEII